MDLHGLLAAISNKHVDLVIAALSVTPERKAHVDFSIPYASTNVAMLYRATDIISDLNALKNKVIGAQLGTTWAQIAEDLSAKFQAKTHLLSNNLMLVEELKSNAIDVIILEEFQTRAFMANNPELASMILPEFSSEFAIALPLHSKLKTSIDEAINALNGENVLNDLKAKWLK
jgi:ABC-type amino acid transport substrate-binding protein